MPVLPRQLPPGYAEEDIGPRLVAVSVTFIVLNTLVVAARFAARTIYGSKFGADDYLIIPALLFALGMCIISIIEVYMAGVGRHLAYLYAADPQAIINWAKCGYAIEEIYCAAVAFPKLSILASYLRIFTTKPYRVATYAVGSVITAAMIAGIITSLASCKTFEDRWNPELFVSSCINAVHYWEGMSVPNIVTDVVMLILPIPVVWSLHMSTNRKLALSGVFLLGSFGIIASCLRLAVTVRMHNLDDGTYDSADIALWSTVESGCYLIAACLPILRPFIISLGGKVGTVARGPTMKSGSSGLGYRSNRDDLLQGGKHPTPISLKSIRTGNHTEIHSTSDKNFLLESQYTQLDEEA